MDYKTSEKQREYSRRYYWMHREERNAYSRQYRWAHRAEELQRGRWRRAAPGYKEKHAEYYRQWYQKNGRNRAEDYLLKRAEYQKQHRLENNVAQRFRNYVNSGIIERPKYCSICGGDGSISAHHPDYDKPFEVIWCCSSCHKQIHLGEDLRLEIQGDEIST